MRITNYYIWSLVFSVFYLVVLTMFLIILDTEARKTYEELTVLEIGLLMLATWRMTRLLTFDKITAWFREQFYDIKKVGRGYTLVKPDGGPRRVLVDLFECPWCMSITVATVLSFFFLLFTWFYFIVLLLAVSAVGAAAQVLTRRVVSPS